jgi:hypothetical protein
MPSWAEILGDRPIRGEEALGMPGGFEPLHAPLALAGGLVGILLAVVTEPPLKVRRRSYPKAALQGGFSAN